MFPKFPGDYYGSFVYDEAKALAGKGFQVHVVTQHNPGIPYEEVVDQIHIHRFKWLEPKTFRALVHFKGFMDVLRMITYVISLFFNLIWIIWKYKIQIIHAHSVIPTGFMSSIASKIMGKPLFITAHGMDINNFEKKPFFNYFISRAMNSSSKSIAVSEDLAKKMRKMVNDENKIVVLRNAVDTGRFNPTKNRSIRKDFGIRDEEILILFVGYLDEFKGIFELINAFNKITAENSNVKLMMVGTGPKKEDLLEILNKVGIEDKVIFTGVVEHQKIHRYYQSADIFVLPSYTEGLPVSILEAMATGVPVVATSVGGVPELITHGLNGFIVPPRDEEAFIEKLLILINDKNLRQQYANRSLKKIKEEFDIKVKISKLIELYKSSGFSRDG